MWLCTWVGLLGLLTTFSSPLLLRITMAFAFEKLEVYQKAVSFADRVCQTSEGFSQLIGKILIHEKQPSKHAHVPSIDQKRRYQGQGVESQIGQRKNPAATAVDSIALLVMAAPVDCAHVQVDRYRGGHEHETEV